MSIFAVSLKDLASSCYYLLVGLFGARGGCSLTFPAGSLLPALQLEACYLQSTRNLDMQKDLPVKEK